MLCCMNLRDELASYAHASWCGWMVYLFSLSDSNADGSVTIPPGLVERWKRQCSLAYDALPESERASDLAEADKILAIVSDMPLYRTQGLIAPV